MDLINTILPVVTKDLPISPWFTPFDFLSRCKFNTLTTRQPMVEFYLLAFPRFPLRKKEHKSYFGKNRTHDFRTSRCAGYPLDHSGDECDKNMAKVCRGVIKSCGNRKQYNNRYQQKKTDVCIPYIGRFVCEPIKRTHGCRRTTPSLGVALHRSLSIRTRSFPTLFVHPAIARGIFLSL